METDGKKIDANIRKCEAEQYGKDSGQHKHYAMMKKAPGNPCPNPYGKRKG